MVKIFIVDDDQSLQRLYALILKEAGIEIIGTAFNGKKAVEIYLKFNDKPDLILMDHRMPIKNGIDAMKEILQINKNEKIIFASADVTVKQEVLSLGALAFLDKPFNMKRLLNTIDKVIEKVAV